MELYKAVLVEDNEKEVEEAASSRFLEFLPLARTSLERSPANLFRRWQCGGILLVLSQGKSVLAHLVGWNTNKRSKKGTLENHVGSDNLSCKARRI
jgi:hypothetical protein